MPDAHPGEAFDYPSAEPSQPRHCDSSLHQYTLTVPTRRPEVTLVAPGQHVLLYRSSLHLVKEYPLLLADLLAGREGEEAYLSAPFDSWHS